MNSSLLASFMNADAASTPLIPDTDSPDNVLTVLAVPKRRDSLEGERVLKSSEALPRGCDASACEDL